MSPKGTCPPALLLLVFLVATALFPQSEGTAYREFIRRHLNYPKEDFGNDRTYCNHMMRHRNLKCQRGNTFIHASEEQVASICTSRGRKLEGNQTSKTLFPITICTLGKGPRKLFCNYSGKSRITKIRVTCSKGLPVHYISRA